MAADNLKGGFRFRYDRPWHEIAVDMKYLVSARLGVSTLFQFFSDESPEINLAASCIDATHRGTWSVHCPPNGRPGCWVAHLTNLVLPQPSALARLGIRGPSIIVEARYFASIARLGRDLQSGIDCFIDFQCER